jgi:flagellar protein FliO/FliZ
MYPLTFFVAFVAVLALIGLVAWLVRRFATNRLGTNPNRGRMPRLAVIDAAAVDGRRRLVLVRRDNVEHLLMIGGPTDIVVEPNIVRAQAGREQLPQRTGGVGTELPPRIAPLPDAAWAEGEAARGDGGFDLPEPQMPEPPQRPARPSFADEVRRPMPAHAERRPDPRNDPLAGFAPEPINTRIEPRPEPREPRPEPRPEPMPQRMTRAEPLMPRPQRATETPKPPPMRAPAPERAAAPPPPPPPPAPPPPLPQNADQNLAEMAQRLEAALRRPASSPEAAPPVAPEPPPVRAARTEPQAAPAKSSFENLEDEMASLLGRPKPSSS